MSLQWPESVAILDPECGHELNARPGANSKNEPQSPRGWAEEEFRGSSASSSQVDLMLKIWLYRYDCLLTYRTKYSHTYSNYDHYNAAWVACGYTEDQSPQAMELCQKRFGTPTGEVLDDPHQVSRKKV